MATENDGVINLRRSIGNLNDNVVLMPPYRFHGSAGHHVISQRCGQNFHVTPRPAVHCFPLGAIAKLEQAVGRPVLVRTPRRLDLTAAGRELLGHARRLLAQHDEAVQAMQREAIRGHLSVGVPEDYAVPYLAPVLREFARRHAGVELTLVCQQSTVLIPRVLHGEKDYRVPVTQGLEFYNTLRLKGVPTRLVYFPDENHWILKPQNSRLWHREVFAWLEKYIGHGPTQ